MMAGEATARSSELALGLPFWSAVAGFALDAAVVAAFALCIAALSTVSVLPLALGAAFAVAGKALGATMAYLSQGADGDEELVASYSPDRLTGSAGCCRISRASIGGSGRCISWRRAETVFWSVTMAVAYIVLLLVCCQPAVLRREFS
jgi:Cu-processing system permease protein